uniref:Calponin-homology (CH) domain-containing protein n=2 Tax=Palpitomonas bilix TaxID=652834 RepID=A0A7S3G2E1_9EUKA|mmetsp:Transcript_13279/g.34811  ORF Transcript_13279/g.34811 Transcript_13279/m.34811 type:complete len:959 (+) Transcript_13279:184-3060(+)
MESSLPRLLSTPTAPDGQLIEKDGDDLPSLSSRPQVKGSDSILRRAAEIADKRKTPSTQRKGWSAGELENALENWSHVRRDDYFKMAREKHIHNTAMPKPRANESPASAICPSAQPERPKTTSSVGIVAKEYWRTWGARTDSTWGGYQEAAKREKVDSAKGTRPGVSRRNRNLSRASKRALAEQFKEVHNRSFEMEEGSFVSEVKMSEVKWEEALTVAQRLGFPNEFTTAVALSILEKLLRLSPAFERLCDSLLLHIRLSILTSSREKLSESSKLSQKRTLKEAVKAASMPEDEVHSKGLGASEICAREVEVPYFRLYRTMRKENGKLLKKLHEMHLRGGERKRIIEQTLRRWQLSLAGMAFRHWKNTTAVRKRQTKILTRFFAARESKLLALCFKEWARLANRRLRLALQDRLTEVSLERERFVGDNEDLKHSVRKLEIESKEYEQQYLRLMDDLYTAQETLKTLTTGSTRANAEKRDELVKLARVSLKMARGMLDNLRVKVDEASTLQDPSPLVNSLEKISEYFPGLQQIDTTEDLVGVPAQEVLVRWMNFHLQAAGSKRVVENFSSCLQDCVCWCQLCTHIMVDFPADDVLALNDFTARSAKFLKLLKGRGLTVPLLPEHVAKGIPEMNLLLAIELFRVSPGLKTSMDQVKVSLDGAWDHLIAFESMVEAEERKTYKLMAQGGGVTEIERACFGLIMCIELGDDIGPLPGWSDEFHQMQIMLNHVQGQLQEKRQSASQMATICSKLQQQVSDLGVSIVEQRVKGETVSVFDTRSLRERKKFTKLFRERIQDLLSKESDPDGEHHKCETILERYVDLLQQTYRYYGTLDGGLTISMKEFWKFAKDCKLASKSLPLAAIDVIFVRSNWKSSEGSGDIHNPERELIPGEFSESLLRISSAKYDGSARTLSQKLQTLIDMNILKFAGRADPNKVSDRLLPSCTYISLNAHEVAERFCQA